MFTTFCGRDKFTNGMGMFALVELPCMPTLMGNSLRGWQKTWVAKNKQPGVDSLPRPVDLIGRDKEPGSGCLRQTDQVSK